MFATLLLLSIVTSHRFEAFLSRPIASKHSFIFKMPSFRSFLLQSSAPEVLLRSLAVWYGVALFLLASSEKRKTVQIVVMIGLALSGPVFFGFLQGPYRQWHQEWCSTPTDPASRSTGSSRRAQPVPPRSSTSHAGFNAAQKSSRGKLL